MTQDKRDLVGLNAQKPAAFLLEVLFYFDKNSGLGHSATEPFAEQGDNKVHKSVGFFI